MFQLTATQPVLVHQFAAADRQQQPDQHRSILIRPITAHPPTNAHAVVNLELT
jgi:hypothetical protein